MKVRIQSALGDDFGIELTAETEREDKMLRRLWRRGVQVHAVTERKDNSSLGISPLATPVGTENVAYPNHKRGVNQ